MILKVIGRSFFMGTGYLTLKLETAGLDAPTVGAKVTVTDTEYNMLYNLIASGNGAATKAESEAPMVSDESNKLPAIPAPEIFPPFPGTNLNLGDRNTNVLIMQRYLNVIKRFCPYIPALTEDGVFGPVTQNAVLAFQRLFGLTQDGIIGPLTWNKIVSVYNSIGGSGNSAVSLRDDFYSCGGAYEEDAAGPPRMIVREKIWTRETIVE